MTNLTDKLLELGSRWNLAVLEEEIRKIEADTSISVGFLGDFNSGKSTLLNQIVSIDGLLPTDTEPCTVVATKLVSVAGLTGPEYYRFDGASALSSIDHPTFDDMVRGRVSGLPIAHVPCSPGFPSGFVLVDTAGLGSLDLAHDSGTIRELLYLDATVLCVEAVKGGLPASILTFLKSAAFKHLRQTCIVAVTKADLVPSAADLNKIVTKVAGGLAGAVGFKPEEANQRVFTVSAGPEAKIRDLSGLRNALEAVVVKRRTSIQAERQARATQRLLPLAIRLLEQQHSAIREPDDAFAVRISELDNSIEGVRKVRKAHEDRMEKLQGDIRNGIRNACDTFRPVLAAAKNATEIDEACAKFSESLSSAVQRCLQKVDDSFRIDAAFQSADMKRMLSRVNDAAAFGKMMATACVVSLVAPGAGAAANTIEAAEGAAVQKIASQGPAQITARAASQGALTNAGFAVLKTLNDINPVNFIGDMIAEEVKLGRLQYYLDRIAGSAAGYATRLVEEYYQTEYFAPAERELDSLKKALEDVACQRRTDLNQRVTRCASLLNDIEELRKLNPVEAV